MAFFLQVARIHLGQLDFARIGLGICYDIRFPELAMIAARQGKCTSEGVLQNYLYAVDRLPSFDLPRGVQFNDWSFTLEALATRPVRGIARLQG